MNKKRAIKIKKRDWNRVVLTETAPIEVPLICSNEGFYRNLLRIEGQADRLSGLFKKFLEPTKDVWTSPMKYKISKDGLSPRTLWMLHPIGQIRIQKFYRDNGPLMAYYGSRSLASIRAPYKIAGTLFKRDSKQAVMKYRSQGLDGANDASSNRFPKSFFTYRGFRRIFRFFSSEEFIGLEMKYSDMWCLDFSRCFNSIYTHSITWAVKNKALTKDYLEKHKNKRSLGLPKSFGDDFDKTISGVNDGETNGIPIGPEVSRVFAEIILQRVDQEVIAKLEKENLIYGQHYELRRYVDDYFVFSNSELNNKRVYEAIDFVAAEYCLNLNERKTVKLKRPFQTPKSIVVAESKRLISEFMESITVRKEDQIFPLTVFRHGSAKLNFINRIKTIVAGASTGYEAIAPYVIGALNKRVIELVEGHASKVSKTVRSTEEQYYDVISLILDLMFYLFEMCPIHSTSAALSEAVIISLRFFRQEYPRRYDELSLGLPGSVWPES